MAMQLVVKSSPNYGNQLYVILEQGDNTPIIINFPYDLTGTQFEGTIKFPNPVVLSIGNGITVLNAVGGQISLQLTTAQTQDIFPASYPFDLWTVSPSMPAVNTDPLTGFFQVNKAITRIS